MIEVLLIVKIF